MTKKGIVMVEGGIEMVEKRIKTLEREIGRGVLAWFKPNCKSKPHSQIKIANCKIINQCNIKNYSLKTKYNYTHSN